ncbi:PspA-associated protein PspAB [Nocardioides sp. LHG3406-4]|uniref:PspA-associated protein PspAB n=1 Tax=Nocardioides sp. LHG3406-4 TaxID=2804575 RepID=UPI003CF594B4
MGLWDAMTGRSRIKEPDLDAMFLVPSAAITLQTAAGFMPTGTGAVCYRAAAGAAFAQAQADIVALIDDEPAAPSVTTTTDAFGFTWLEVVGSPDDMAGLCTDLHAVNSTIEAQGFGGGLLCTLVPFRDAAGRTFGLVYLYKQGTFYPFAPVPGLPAGEQRRDNLLEITVRDHLQAELPFEKDLQRWLAVWDARGL